MEDVLYMPSHKMHHIQQGIFVDLLALTFWCHDAGWFWGHFQYKKKVS